MTPKKSITFALHAYRRGGEEGYFSIQLCPADNVNDNFHRVLTEDEKKKFCWDVAYSRFRQDYNKYGVDTRDFHTYKYWRDFIAAGHPTEE